MKSDTIGKLAEALAKAQGEMQNASKDKANPFFKSTYADLASVWGACRGPLSRNGLSVSQPLEMLDGKLILTTILMHTSGEWISSQMPIITAKTDPQTVGSCITYYRRFSLSGLVGIAPAEKPTEHDVDDDDDGNAASGNKPPQEHHDMRTQTMSGKPSRLPPSGSKVVAEAPPNKPSDPRRVEYLNILELCKQRNIEKAELEAMIETVFHEKPGDLTLEQLIDFRVNYVVKREKIVVHPDWEKEATATRI